MLDLDPAVIDRLRVRGNRVVAGSADETWESAIARSRRRRRHVAIGLGSAVVIAIAAITTSVQVRSHGERVSVEAPTVQPLEKPAAADPVPLAPLTAATATAPGFLLYLGGTNPSGPVVSSTRIEGRVVGTSGPDAGLIASAGVSIYDPVISPNHRLVAYLEGKGEAVGSSGGEGQLVVSNIDGSNPTVVIASGATSPSWSPTSSQVALLENGAIWIVDANGTNPHPLLSLDANTVTWSPSGDELAVGAGDPSTVGIINLKTVKVRWITPKGVEEYDPSWSPDGHSLVFGMGGVESIFVSNVNGSAIRQVTPNCAIQPCDQQFQPAWSPDGTRIAYTQETNGVLQIFVVSSSGGSGVQVTAAPEQHEFPSW